MGAHSTASLLAGAAGGLMAHQFVDDPGRDAGVLQPGREGVPRVVGTMQIHGLQQRITGRRQRSPTLLTVLAGAGDQVGSHKLAQGDLMVAPMSPTYSSATPPTSTSASWNSSSSVANCGSWPSGPPPPDPEHCPPERVCHLIT